MGIFTTIKASALTVKLIAALATVTLVLGSIIYVQHLRHSLATQRVATAAAVAAVHRVALDLKVERDNRVASETLVADVQARAQVTATRVADLEREVNRARKPLPKICDPLLDPFRDVARGVLGFQSSGSTGGPAAARRVPDVRP